MDLEVPSSFFCHSNLFKKVNFTEEVQWSGVCFALVFFFRKGMYAIIGRTIL